jgi:hypothetical protein
MMAEQTPDGDDRRRSAARFLHFMQSAGTLEVIERQQRILLAADQAMEMLPPWPELDEEFWAEYRRSMIDAGATDTDLEYFADHFVRLVVEMTPCKPEDRTRLLDALANHFALADVEVLPRTQ